MMRESRKKKTHKYKCAKDGGDPTSVPQCLGQYEERERTSRTDEVK